MKFSTLDILYTNYYYDTIKNAYFCKRRDMSRGIEIHSNDDSTFISEYLTGMLYEPRGNEKILIHNDMIRPLDELENIVFKKILESI